MAVQERALQLTNVAQCDVSRPAGIPWWAIVYTVVLVLLLLAIWNMPIWADSGRGPTDPALDEIPGWIITLLVMGTLAGIRELAIIHKR